MSEVIRARWVLPIEQPPIENGWVETAGGVIVAVGAGAPPGHATDLGDVAVLPALVNAHTHLELSWLSGRVAPADSMPAWIRAMLAERRAPPGEPEIARALDEAIADAIASGTAVFGDISNGLTTPAPLAAAGAVGVVFHELIGFRVLDAEPVVAGAWERVDASATSVATGRNDSPDLAFSVVAHAPYSVSPALFAEIARTRRTTPLSVHAGESPEEIELLYTGAGPFRQFLEDMGAWRDDWQAPRCGPIEYLRRVGYLQRGMIAVHGGHLTDHELIALRDAGGVLVTCPRSNVWVGAGAPDASRFYRAGLPVALGTDSLASASSLNMFDELAALRRAASDIHSATLLASATIIGAHALQRDRTHGSIATGKCAALIAVDLPHDVGDVEEYLVSGVPRSSVRNLAHDGRSRPAGTV